MNLKLVKTALSWLGVLGVGVTSWLSVKCSRKADQQTQTGEKVKAYAPAIVSGIATVSCILGANHISDKEIAALAAGCAYMAKSRAKSMPAAGAAAEKKPEKAEIAPWEGPSVEWTGKGTLLCFEGYSGRLFYSSKEAVEKAEDEFNANYEQWDIACLNDFYRLLGISETHFGEQYGWSRNSDYYGKDPIEIRNIETTAENGEKMLIIEIVTYPMECWQEV